MTPRARRLAKYGLTPRQYAKLLKLQGGCCAVCGRKPKTRRLAVEHAHDTTKRVRGLCCSYCNRFLIAKNTAATALLVLRYLERDFDARTL